MAILRRPVCHRLILAPSISVAINRATCNFGNSPIYLPTTCLKAKGHLEEDVWRGWETIMRDINAYPGVQAWWRTRSHWFGEEFAKFVGNSRQPRLQRCFANQMEDK